MGIALEFRHVDVFTEVPFTGNGLIVLFGRTAGVRAELVLSLTLEMRAVRAGPGRLSAGDRQGDSEDLYCRGGAAVHGPSRHWRGGRAARAPRRRRSGAIVGLRDCGSLDYRAQPSDRGPLRSGADCAF